MATDLALISISKSRGKSVELDPAKYFEEWYYKIEQCHYPAFDVALREFVDKEKSHNRRIETGNKAIKIMRRAWSIQYPQQFDFHEGDLFYSMEKALQIVYIKDQLEIHLIYPIPQSSRTRDAYLVSESELAGILKTGFVNEKSRITPDQSSKETLRYFIRDPNEICSHQMNLNF